MRCSATGVPLRGDRVAPRLHTSSDLLRKLALRARVITRLSARRISPRAERGTFPAHPPHSRFGQLVKKVGEEKAMAMLEKSEEGFKENYALLKKLSEM